MIKLVLSFFLSFLFLFADKGVADTGLYSLRVPELVHDFGLVERGEVLEHRFEIYNESDHPIEIKEIKPSCGCTTATETPFNIPARESRQIELKVDTKGRTGKMEQRIGVVTSDPKRENLTFILRGNIQAGAYLDKSVIRFEQAKQNKKYSQTLIVKGRTDQSISVQEVQSSISFLKFEVGKRNKRKNTTKVKIILLKDAPVGPFKGWVYIITDEKLDPTYWVRVYGVVVN